MLILALAMQTTVTTCQPVLGATQCTSRSNGPIDYGAQMPKLQMPIITRGGGGYKPSKRARKAGRMIAAGQCKEAEAYALGEGDFTLASQVRVECMGRNSPK